MTARYKTLIAGVIAGVALLWALWGLDIWTADASVGGRLAYTLRGLEICTDQGCVAREAIGTLEYVGPLALWLGTAVAIASLVLAIAPVIGVGLPTLLHAWTLRAGVVLLGALGWVIVLAPPLGPLSSLFELVGSRSLGCWVSLLGAVAALATAWLARDESESMEAFVVPAVAARPPMSPTSAEPPSARAAPRALRPIEPIELAPAKPRPRDPFDPNGNDGGA